MLKQTLSLALAGLDDHFGSGDPDPNDPSLCDDLDRFVHGASPDMLSTSFRTWVEALGRVRVQDGCDVRFRIGFCCCVAS